MQGNYLSKKNSCLRIGDYNIEIVNQFSNNFNYQIPFKGDAFTVGKNTEIDFFLEISINKYLEYPSNLIYKQISGFNPICIYKDNNITTWVNIKDNDKDKSKLTFQIYDNWKRIRLIEEDSKDKEIEWFEEVGHIIFYSVLNYGGIVFHGVIMEHNGVGILVCGKSGAGKTTHTRIWRDYKNALILNGDRALCRKRDGVWYGYGSPWSGSSGEYINRKVPITAIVLLERGEENEVERISPYEGAMGLIPRTFAPTWEHELIGKALDTIDDIVQEIPVLRLKCRPDLESVEVLEKAINGLGK